MSADAASPVASPQPKRRRPLLKLTIALLVAVAVVVAAVQAFLWSDYPRQIGQHVATNLTGLRVQIGKLTLTWSGVTTIEDLRVALPLDDRPLLTVPKIVAEHTSLPGIVLTLGGIAIDRVRIDRPETDARQNADGTWNLQQAIGQLAALGKSGGGSGAAKLPDVSVDDGVIHLTPAAGKTVDVRGITVTGRNDAALAYALDANLGGLADAKGKLSPSGRWPHELVVVVRPSLLNTAGPLIGTVPVAASATIQWQGERTPTGVAGRLTLPEKTTQFGPITAVGVAKVNVDGANVSLTPDGLTVSAPAAPPVTLAGGSVQYAGGRVTLDGLRVRTAEGTARLDGSADVAAQRGNVTASWEQIAFPPGVVHGGTATIEAANIWPGRPWVKVAAHVSGTAAGATFETQASVTGDGPRWTDATYVVDLPLVRYARRSAVELTDIQATIHNSADSVELTEVRLRQTNAGTATLAARGAYYFAGPNQGTGTFTAVGDGFAFAGQSDLAFNLNLWADKKTVTLQNAHARIGTQASANLIGDYIIGDPKPIRMRLDFDTTRDAAFTLSKTVAVAGHAKGKMKVGGTLDPLNVTLDGDLTSRNLKLGRYVVGDADLVVSGAFKTDRASLQTERLDAFGGGGRFGADFPYFSDTLHAWTDFAGINLAEVAAAVGAKDLTGTAAGQFDLFVPIGDMRYAYGSGQIDVAKPAAGKLVAAETLTIPVHIGEGYVRLDPTAVQAKGGRIDVTANVDLDQPLRLKDVDVLLKDWLTPLPLAEYSATTGGRIDLPQLDLLGQAASGRISLRSEVFAHDKPIGNASVRVQADGRQIRLESLGGQVLGGELFGQGNIDLDALAAGRLDAGIKGLSLDRLTQIDPRLTGMEGRLGVTLATHAAEGERPLGPVQIDLNVASDRATYKDVEVGDINIRAFLDKDRVALNDEKGNPNVIHLAGGTAKLWGRLGEVPAGPDGVKRTSAFVSLRLDGIDCEQLNRMIDPDGKPTPGKLAGDVVAFGNPADPRRFGGQGQFQLSDSDLANVGIISVLYDAMRLGIGAGEPKGYGNVAFRLSDGRLDVTSMDYFNRGIYARGAFSLNDALAFKDSPVSGYVLGTVRPLKDLDLPLIGTFDSILDALQRSATTLRIEGTMEKDKLKVVPVSLKNASGDLKNILVGESQSK